MYDAATRAGILTRIDRRGAYAHKRICPCFVCQQTAPPTHPYLYLLGQYLGDGCIDRMGRSWILRIATCDAYPCIRQEVVQAIGQLVTNRVHFVKQQGCTTVGCITRQWLHLFPQHGPGRKHERPIVLQNWQRQLLRRIRGH